MGNIYNQISWSISRSTLLNYCQKKYYFTYYTNYLREIDTEFWLECLLIKNLQSLDMRVWQKTHQLLSDYLNEFLKWEKNIDTDKIFWNIVEEIKKDFKISKEKDYTRYDKNNKFGLNEHYRWENIDHLLEDKINKIQKYFNNFLSSKIHKKISEYLKNWNNRYFVEEREANFEKMKFLIENIPWLENIIIWAQPDFWIIENEYKYIIYDRKTWKIPENKENKVSDQLKVYAYKILLRIWLDKINKVWLEWWETYLDNMTVYWWNILPQDLENIESKILSDVNFQKKLLINIENNIPKKSSYFQKTEKINKCKTCRFNKVCSKLANYENDNTN